MGLAVHLSTVANRHHDDTQIAVLDVGDNSVILHAVLPEIARLGTFEDFANAARVVQPATRPTKDVAIGLAICLSNFAKFFLAPSSNLISQTKSLLHFGQGVGFGFSCAVGNQSLLGEVQIFEVVYVLSNGLDRVKSFAAPCEFSQMLKAA
jgi:hypothetical protein